MRKPDGTRVRKQCQGTTGHREEGKGKEGSERHGDRDRPLGSYCLEAFQMSDTYYLFFSNTAQSE